MAASISLAGPFSERPANERQMRMVRLLSFAGVKISPKGVDSKNARKSREKCGHAKLLLLGGAQAFQALGLILERLGVGSVGLQGQVVAIELRRLSILVFTGKNIGEKQRDIPPAMRFIDLLKLARAQLCGVQLA